MQETLYAFEKNRSEEVRLGLETYKGHQCIDIRCFVVPPLGSQEGTPTPKGLKLRVEQFPELAKGIEKIGKVLAQAGKDKSAE